jgi:hypothetical protein
MLEISTYWAISGACGIHHASVWSRTVSVNLMKSHGNHATWSDLRKCCSVLCHDLSSSSLDVVGTSTKGLSASISGIALEAGGVLLEGLTTRAVTRGTGVNY